MSGKWLFAAAPIFFLLIAAVWMNKHSNNYNEYDKTIFSSKKVENERERSKGYIALFVVLLTVIIFLTLYHYSQLMNHYYWTMTFIFLSFLWMSFILISSFSSKKYTDSVSNLHATVVIPVYNEHPSTIEKVLNSLSNQTTMPDVIYVIEDGSDKENQILETFNLWKDKNPHIISHYSYIPNSGKREAQAIAFREYEMKTDIFITIDSDTILEKSAIENILKPFSDERVQSAAGLLFNYNNKKLFNKMIGLNFVSSFTSGRAAWSYWKSVSVSCGGLAAYRSEVIRRHLTDYLNQMVLGATANYGDDRMLTQYASLHGQTVYQESAIGYTLLPENLSHLTRQRVRWWKSFWWGGLWVLKHQSMRRGIWWLTLSQYISFLLYSIIFPFVFIVNPVSRGDFPEQMFIYMIGISYLRTLRSLTVRRNDTGKAKQFFEWLFLAPLSSLINLYLCTFLQYWSLFKLKDVRGWGTRQKVEVLMDNGDQEK